MAGFLSKAISEQKARPRPDEGNGSYMVPTSMACPLPAVRSRAIRSQWPVSLLIPYGRAVAVLASRHGDSAKVLGRLADGHHSLPMLQRLGGRD